MGRQSIRLFFSLALAVAVSSGYGQDWVGVHREEEAKWAAHTGLTRSAVHKLWRLASHFADEGDDDSRIENLDTRALASRQQILLVTSAGENSCLTLTVFLASTPFEKIWSGQQTPEGHEWCGPGAKATVANGRIEVSLPEEGGPGSSGPLSITIYAWDWNGSTYHYVGARQVQQLSAGNSAEPPRTLPLSSLQLPERVRSILEAVSCSVAQTDLAPSPNNVVNGEFARRGQQDWLVLCWNGNQNIPFVVWGGDAKCDYSFATDLRMLVQTGQLKTTIVPELEVAAEAKTHGIEGGHQWIRIRWSPLTSLFYSCDDGRWTEHSEQRCKTQHSATTVSPSTVQETLAAQKDGHQPWRSDPTIVAEAELRRILASITSPFVLELHGADMKCEAILGVKQLCYYWDKSSGISASIRVERFASGIWFATESSVTTCSQ